MKTKIFIIGIALGLFLNSCILNDGKKLPEQMEYSKETVQYKVLPNVADSLLSLDVYYMKKDSTKTTKKKPVVIFAHGGKWASGDKSTKMYNKPDFFFNMDYIFVSTNYRLSPYPVATGKENRVKFPDHNNDIADAIKWVFDNISEYGGDPDNIALMGFEAGGHLMALTASNNSFLARVGLSLDNIKGVAVIESEAFNIETLTESSSMKDVYINAFGKDETLYKEASPIHQIVDTTPYYPPFCIIKNTAIPERAEAVDRFIEILEGNGQEVFEYDGVYYKTTEKIHSVIGDPMETNLTPALATFFKECFMEKKETE